MTAVITHSVSAGGTVDATADVDGAAWDANHVITGVMTPAQGGTGVVNNDASTITISGSFGATFTLTAATGVTFPTTGTLATTSNKLSAFAATTSAELAGVISDETGSGALVFGTSPTLTTPTLGVATATSINKMAITAPATSSTLAVADGKTATVSNTLTFTGTDGSSAAFGAGGTVAYTANKLSAFAATTSAELAGVISDETGSGALVFAASPTLTGTVTAAAANFSGTITFGTGTITGLTNKASPSSTDDYVIIYDLAGTAIKKATVGSVGSAGAVSSIAGNTGAFTLSGGVTNSVNDIRLSNMAAYSLKGNVTSGSAAPTDVNVGAWSTWTPTITAGSGSITTVGTVTARYLQIGKIVLFAVDINITTNGTGAARVIFTLPVTAASTPPYVPFAALNIATGVGNIGQIGDTTHGWIFKYDGSYPAADGAHIIGSGCYEAA